MSTVKKLSEFFADKRMLKIAMISGVVAIVLIAMSSFLPLVQDSGKAGEEYGEKLKEQLIAIVTHIDGVGKAEIFLTMDNGGENIYLTNSDTKTKSIEPTVRGVVIACEGGDDPVVEARLLDAVTKSLSISSDKVCITKLSHS